MEHQKGRRGRRKGRVSSQKMPDRRWDHVQQTSSGTAREAREERREERAASPQSSAREASGTPNTRFPLEDRDPRRLGSPLRPAAAVGSSDPPLCSVVAPARAATCCESKMTRTMTGLQHPPAVVCECQRVSSRAAATLQIGTPSRQEPHGKGCLTWERTFSVSSPTKDNDEDTSCPRCALLNDRSRRSACRLAEQLASETRKLETAP